MPRSVVSSPFSSRRLPALLALLALFAIGCGSEPTSGDAAVSPTTVEAVAIEDIRLGLAVQSLDRTFFTGMADGASAASAAHGVSLEIVDAGDDHDIQLDRVVDMLPRIDALLLSPVDSARSAEIVERATEAGVAVVAVANQVGAVDEHGSQYVHPLTVALVTNDDVSMGRKAGAFVAVQQLEGRVRIAVLSGARGTANVAMRLDGFEQELDALGIDYEIVADVDGAWNADGGRAACLDFEASSPDLIFSMSDAMTEGCVESLRSGDLAGIPVVSIGGNQAGVGLLRAGDIVGSVCQKPGDMGALAVDVAVTSLTDGASSLGLQFYETPLVTLETLELCTPQW